MPNAAPSDQESEVWNAIQICEQILEAMPSDRHALQTLASAYEQVGDHVRAMDCLVRLGEVLIAEGDAQAAAALRNRLLEFADVADAQDLLGRLESVGGATEAEGDPATPTASLEAAEPPEPPNAGFDVGTEVALAWALREDGAITQDEYSMIVDDLGKLAAGDKQTTISVLHVLQDRGYSAIERLLATLARRFERPFVSLARFHLAREVVTLLPLSYMVWRGVLPFATLGPNVLVALLNPHDAGLRQDVERRLRQRCHFYLVNPLDFDRAMDKVRELLATTGA